MPNVSELHQELLRFESGQTPPEQQAESAARVCRLARRLLSERGLPANLSHEAEVSEDVSEVLWRIEAGDFLTMSERSYRRGVPQALALAAGRVRRGADADNLDELTDEAEEMRRDRGAHLAYLDDLFRRVPARQRIRRKATQNVSFMDPTAATMGNLG